MYLKVVKLCKVPRRLREEVVSGQHSHPCAIQGVDCGLACKCTPAGSELAQHQDIRMQSWQGCRIGHAVIAGGYARCKAAHMSLDSPLRILQLSTTSSCTKLAVWIISVISASRRCCGVMSLRNRSKSG